MSNYFLSRKYKSQGKLFFGKTSVKSTSIYYNTIYVNQTRVQRYDVHMYHTSLSCKIQSIIVILNQNHSGVNKRFVK